MQTKTALIYSESIDKLKSVLSAMHNMSQKREKLEKKLRFKLEREIRRLKAEMGEEVANGHLTEGEGLSSKLAELQLQNATLEADIVKVCYLLVDFASGSTCFVDATSVIVWTKHTLPQAIKNSLISDKYSISTV